MRKVREQTLSSVLLVMISPFQQLLKDLVTKLLAMLLQVVRVHVALALRHEARIGRRSAELLLLLLKLLLKLKLLLL